VDPYYHSMVLPQVADRRNGLQLCRVAANTKNEERGEPTMGGPPV
jgi:hypothetical protein